FSATRGAAQTMKTTLLTAVTVVRVAAGVIGGTKVLGNGFEADKVVDPIWDWIKEVIIPPLAELEMRLETLAFYFGVFLPSLPYA
ncbi:type IV secretion system protein DotA-like protein, partial [Xanthomonas citri pv. citri]|nr:type IV secretion system protein DotA-like protein [Xanthomonas citri pv. citri]